MTKFVKKSNPCVLFHPWKLTRLNHFTLEVVVYAINDYLVSKMQDFFSKSTFKSENIVNFKFEVFSQVAFGGLSLNE